jgi:hypothetical protein
MPKTKKAKSSTRNGKPSDAATIRQLRKRIKELEHNVERYRNLLIARLPEPPPHLRMTREEMKEAEENPYTLDDFIKRLEADLKAAKKHAS